MVASHPPSRTGRDPLAVDAPTMMWQPDVPSAIRSLDPLASPDYADLFIGTTRQAKTKSAEQWIRAILEDAPAALRLLIPILHRSLLGLRLAPRPSPGHVPGWQLADR